MENFTQVTNKFFQTGSFAKFVPDELSTVATYLPDERTLCDVMRKAYIKHERERIKEFDARQMAELLEPVKDELLQPVQRAVYKSFMTYLVTTDKIQYPLFVHASIADILIKRKCNIEESMMHSESKKVLQDLARDMNMDNFLNLSKKDLCRAISDINSLAKAHANQSLTTCYAGLQGLESNIVHLKGKQLRATEFIQQEHAVLKKEMEALNLLLDQWQEASFYTTYADCSLKAAGRCTNLFASLHEFARHVTAQATTCNKIISNLKRQYKIGTLDDNAGAFAKLKAHFF